VNTSPLNLLTADQLLTTAWPEPVWAIPKMLPTGLTILAGKAKIGKSWLALQIALAVASGGKALDEQVERGPVLYLALEDPPRRLENRMRKMCWPLGLDAEFMVLGEFAKQIGKLIPTGPNTTGGGLKLAQQIERRAYRLVVIDTLSRAVAGDQDDVAKMTEALSPIQEMAHAQNCAVLLTDHHNKMAFGGDAVTDILGSTAKGALADCVWGLYRERGKTGAKLFITGRDVEERELALTFDGVTGCWQYDGDANELELTERRQEILNIVKRLGSPTLKEIVDATGQNKGNTYTRLQDLVNAGALRTSADGGHVRYAPGDAFDTAMSKCKYI